MREEGMREEGREEGAALRLLLAHGVDSLIYETFRVSCSNSRLNTLRAMVIMISFA